ncbi:GUN4 domain-containing protein, partial [Lyngbya sp. CCY1209]|uniref:GUN4 domain-containing protein n=1 Tax=Lyngbya sp. CCY1209 TaxID=2886103 RepID=UPI002D1FF918
VFLEKERKRIAAAKRVWQQSQCQLQSAQAMVSQLQSQLEGMTQTMNRLTESQNQRQADFQSQLDDIVERIDSLNNGQNQQQFKLNEMNRRIESLIHQQSQQETKIIEAIKFRLKPISETNKNEKNLPTSFDYTQLERLLKSGNWKAADQETARMMLAVAGQTERGYLDSNDIKNFPCEDLRIIDGLWFKCSNGRFGFSVQKQIYINCGGKCDGHYPGDTIWYRFREEVGWKELDDNFQLSPKRTPEGCFPYVLRSFKGIYSNIKGYAYSSLAQRLVTCSI